MLKTLRKNEEIKGKIVTFKTFRELLLDELNKNFPEEYDAYIKNRQTTETASANLNQVEAEIKKEASNNQ